MEVKIVNVQAEKTKDGRIVYYGSRRRSRGRIRKEVVVKIMALFIVFVWVCVKCWSIWANSAPANTNEVEVVVHTPAQCEQMVNVVRLSKIDLDDHNLIIQAENDAVTEIDEEVVEMLALVIYQEAGGDDCIDDTRRMVGEVAMNRVADSRFPDTLEEVLLQRRAYGLLYWTGLVWPDRASNEGEANAVQRAYEIARLVLTSEERLLPTDVVFQAEFRQGTETVAESDGFYFCR